MHLSTIFSAITTVVALVTQVSAAPQYSPNLTKLAKHFPRSDLPAPDGLQLKYVALGVGMQNYTCGSDRKAEPGTTGAVATLYNIGDFLNVSPKPDWILTHISGQVLELFSQHQHATSSINSFLHAHGLNIVLGSHFFTADAVPAFSLSKTPASPPPIFFGKKTADVEAPAGSPPGAVKWLYLTDNGASLGGLSVVYRLNTAGGMKPKTCEGMPSVFGVPYVAQYWMFGPRSR